MKMESFFVSICIVSVVFVVLLKFVAYKFRHLQDAIVYHPQNPPGSTEVCDSPRSYGMTHYEKLVIVTPDGVTLRGYLLSPSHGKSIGSIIYFHGNAGNVGHRLPIARALVQNVKCNVVLVDYRGYGLSDHVTPTEAGLNIDAQAILEYVTTHSSLAQPIVALGISLGGAVALSLAAALEKRSNTNPPLVRGLSSTQSPKKLSGLILENTFTSMSAMADALFAPQILQSCSPNVGPVVVWILQSILKPIVLQVNWNNIDHIRNIPLPMLFLSGDKDELVPCIQMRELFQAARRALPKKFVTFTRGNHNNLCSQPGFLESIHEFMQEIRRINPSE